MSCAPVPAPIAELWSRLVFNFRTVPEALAAADVSELELLDEPSIRRLCHALPVGVGCKLAPTLYAETLDEEAVLRALAGGASWRPLPRASLLRVFSWCAPRQQFVDWANAMLLKHGTTLEIWRFLSTAGDNRRTPRGFSVWENVDWAGSLVVPKATLLEAFALCEVHFDDAVSWLQRLGPEVSEEDGAIEFSVLSRRIVAETALAEDEESQSQSITFQDVAVRIVHCWGDFTEALGLTPPAVAASVAAAADGRRRTSLSPEPCFSPRRSPSASRCRRHRTSTGSVGTLRPATPRAHTPRANSVRQMADELLPERRGDRRPRCVGADRWARALRGSNRTRLWPEAEARREAARLAAAEAQRMHQLQLQEHRTGEDGPSALLALFPNMSERLCLARSTFQPNEQIVVRYSLAEFGLMGSALNMPTLRQPLGTSPFIALVPHGLRDQELVNTKEFHPMHWAALGPEDKGTVVVRAPIHAVSCGLGGLWAVQLFASHDGVHASAAVGRPVCLRVQPLLPGPVERPAAVAATVDSDGRRALTVEWLPPGVVQNGGAPPQAYEIAAWSSDERRSDASPLCAVAGAHVQSPFLVQGLAPDSEYVFRVRYWTEAGVSPWSAPSRPCRTLPTVPDAPGRPEVYGVPLSKLDGLEVMLRWAAPIGKVDGYEITVRPQSADAERRVERVACRPAGDVGMVRANIGGLNGNAEYTFSVAAFNAAGLGASSKPSILLQTLAGAPCPPSVPKQVGVDSDMMTLTWTPPINDGGSPIVRYYVRGIQEADLQRDYSPSKRNPTKLNGPGVIEALTRDGCTMLTMKGLRGNTRYYFQVCALNNTGLSPYSELSEPLLTGRSAPWPPRDVVAYNIKETTLDLKWKPPSNDGGSPVERWHVSCWLTASPAEKASMVTTTPRVTLANLQGNSEYAVEVQAENAEGVSDASLVIVLSGPTKPFRPGKPELLSPPALEVELAWAPPRGETGTNLISYEVRGLVADQTGEDEERTQPVPVVTVEVTRPRATVAGLLPGRSYIFEVRGRNVVGDGLWSEASERIRIPVPPNQPEAPLATSESTRTMLVKWRVVLCPATHEPLTAALEYEVMAVQYGAPSHKRPDQVLQSNELRVLFRGLTAAIPYVFHIRARGLGGWSEWSEPSLPQVTAEVWTREEIVQACLPHCAQSLAAFFRVLDRRSVGYITCEEFCAGLDQIGLSGMPKTQRRILFQEADAASLGRIGVRAFTRCLSGQSQRNMSTTHLLPGSPQKSALSTSPCKASKPRSASKERNVARPRATSIERFHWRGYARIGSPPTRLQKEAQLRSSSRTSPSASRDVEGVDDYDVRTALAFGDRAEFVEFSDSRPFKHENLERSPLEASTVCGDSPWPSPASSAAIPGFE